MTDDKENKISTINNVAAFLLVCYQTTLTLSKITFKQHSLFKNDDKIVTGTPEDLIMIKWKKVTCMSKMMSMLAHSKHGTLETAF